MRPDLKSLAGPQTIVGLSNQAIEKCATKSHATGLTEASYNPRAAARSSVNTEQGKGATASCRRVFVTARCRHSCLGEDVFHDVPMHVREPVVAALEAVGALALTPVAETM